MSVWQEFLIGLAHVYPETNDEVEITNLVYKLFQVLLHHAIKYEYRGWRVWIDTWKLVHIAPASPAVTSCYISSSFTSSFPSSYSTCDSNGPYYYCKVMKMKNPK